MLKGYTRMVLAAPVAIALLVTGSGARAQSFFYDNSTLYRNGAGNVVFFGTQDEIADDVVFGPPGTTQTVSELVFGYGSLSPNPINVTIKFYTYLPSGSSSRPGPQIGPTVELTGLPGNGVFFETVDFATPFAFPSTQTPVAGSTRLPGGYVSFQYSNPQTGSLLATGGGSADNYYDFGPTVSPGFYFFGGYPPNPPGSLYLRLASPVPETGALPLTMGLLSGGVCLTAIRRRRP